MKAGSLIASALAKKHSPVRTINANVAAETSFVLFVLTDFMICGIPIESPKAAPSQLSICVISISLNLPSFYIPKTKVETKTDSLP